MDSIRERLAGLSPEKRELLQKMLMQPTTIPRRPPGVPIPLSFAQERLWFLDQFSPGNPCYNECNALRIEFPLDLEVWWRSLQEIVRRHEALRTTFNVVDGKPVQVIRPSLPPDLRVIDLRHLPELERDAEAQRLAAEEARQPFDLKTGPLMRTMLLRLGEQNHIFVLTLHHIVCDGWSMGVFIWELTSFYWAFVQGRQSPLPELPIQYADYALWQRAWLQDGALDGQLVYWKQQLADLPPLHLPTDRPRPAELSYRGARCPLSIPGQLRDALVALGERENTTLFMILIAALHVLLARYSRQEDFAIGIPVANRDRKELEPLIGMFVNTLVLRTNLAGNPPFVELLRQVREVVLGAFAHQETPFEKLVDALQPKRNTSRNPLFQVAFQFFRAPSATGVPKGQIIPFTPIAAGVAKFDLMFDLVWTEHEVKGHIEYNTDLFDAMTIECLAGHYQMLLDSILRNPEARVSELGLLGTAEKRRVLVEWNNTATAFPREASLQHLFEAQVERAPDAIAVIFDDGQLTYRVLNQRANRIARHLQMLGVGPGALVGISTDRSLALIVGLLGIIKAGGAYVPLDPEYPAQRLAFMLGDAGASVLLTEQHVRRHLSESPVQVVCLDTDAEGWAGYSDQNLDTEVSADSLAYVIYTSGSTGAPKGVAIPQRAVVRLVCNTDYVNLSPADRVAQASNASFDAATFEIWGALLHGACLIGIPKDVLLSPIALAARLREQAITTLFLTTDLFNQLASEEPGVFQPLRTLLFGGSAVDPRWVRAVLRHGPPQRLLHVYGPTESTTYASWYHVREVADDAMTIPIGRPIANTQLYVLDAHLNPAPIGMPGELYIGGDGLAQGYLNHPELTAEKFVPDLFSREPGARLYKTGDLVCYRTTGELEFLRRLDEQVKIRGFRVEPGEIEASLRQHPAVREAVVLAREDIPGDKRLVAYVVPQLAEGGLELKLRCFLGEQLPVHLLPAAFVLLTELPLTPNGKIDRQALPAPADTRRTGPEPWAAPRNSIEEQLTELWAQVLCLERVGIHDNFFELGGDSILSIQIIARARQAGFVCTPKQFFQHQTIAELAAVVIPNATADSEQGVITGPAALTPIEHWFFAQQLPEPHHFNQALLLELQPPLEFALLREAVRRLLWHHDALRLRFEPSASGWQQFHSAPDEESPVTRRDLSALAEAEQTAAIEVAAAETQRSLDLSTGPLLRVVLFELGPSRPSRLLLVIHHLAVDGVSWAILLEDLWAAYAQLRQGAAVQLPPKTTSFQVWAERLRAYAQTPALRQELAYWRAVAGAGEVRLPVDYKTGENTAGSSRTVSVALTASETQALMQEVPRIYQTQINDALLMALAQAFVRWTGASELLVDVEGHGRDALVVAADLSRTVGWLTTIYPVRLSLAGSEEVGAAIKAIKEQLRRVPNRGIGYGLLRYLTETAEISAELAALPQAEVSFNYLGQLGRAATSDALVRLAAEAIGPLRSPLGRRPYLLEINSIVAENQLRLHWTYSCDFHQRATIEQLAADFLRALRELITHCRTAEAGGHTPSDFAKARLSQRDLDRLAARLGQATQTPK